jgi:hypothetical protein
MSIHIHSQTLTASDTWQIAHNLGRKYTLVDVMVDFNGTVQTVIPKAVEIVDENNLIVRFSSPQKGEAKVCI